MANKPKKTKKRKGKIRVKTGAKVVKKVSVRNDTLPKAPEQMPRDNGLNMRVKIRRKTK